MKKKLFGCKDVISVYKFMEICGLHCEVRENIHISHEIMMKKLRLRHSKFPNQVLVPDNVSIKSVSLDKVRCGGIVLVKDDMDNILPYRKPRFFQPVYDYTEEERKEIREQLIFDEMLKVNVEEMPNGYKKYLYRKMKKNMEHQIESTETDIEDYNDVNENVTEHIGRERVLSKRKRYYY